MARSKILAIFFSISILTHLPALVKNTLDGDPKRKAEPMWFFKKLSYYLRNINNFNFFL